MAADIDCHWTGDDDGPTILADWFCHYHPDPRRDPYEDDDDDGPGGGGGGSSNEYYPLGFLAYIDQSVEQDGGPVDAPECPPPGPTTWRNASTASRKEAAKRTAAQAYAWCGADEPTLEQRRILTKALFRIKERGPICKEIADRAQQLLIKGKFRIFKAGDIHSELPVPGGLGYIEGIVLIERYVDLLDDVLGEPPYQVNLEYAIAHESQHVKEGASHITPADAPNYYERNTWDRACAGFESAPK